MLTNESAQLVSRVEQLQICQTHSIPRARLSIVATAGLKVAELVDPSAISQVTQLHEEKLVNHVIILGFNVHGNEQR